LARLAAKHQVVTNIRTGNRELRIAAGAAKSRRRFVSRVPMPIFSYFAVMGSVLVALLFVIDVTVEKPKPRWISSQFTGLPKPWHPETQKLAANPAPEPDTASEDAVKAAALPAVAAAMNRAATTPAVSPNTKKKRVARKRPLPNEAGQRYAWHPGDNAALRGSPFSWRF
jgi:hypothetical protein